MRIEHMPAQVWDWRGSALIFVLVAAPQVGLIGVAPELRSVSVAAALGGLVTYLAILLAALVVYLQYRLSGGLATAWLAAALALASVQGVVWAGLQLAVTERAAASQPWPMVLDQACALGLLTMLLLAPRVPLRRDPMAIGIGVGVGIGAVRLTLVQLSPDVDLSAHGYTVLNLCTFAAFCALAWRVYRLPDLPGWVGLRMAVAIVLLSLSLALANNPPASWLAAATLPLGPVGATLLCSGTLAWLRMSIRSSRQAIAQLSDRLHTVEEDQQANRERLHEINGTIAGIASASRLMQQNPTMPEHHAVELRKMVDTEVERLERLMKDRQPEPLRPVDLDETIRVLVTAQHAVGRTVYWRPSGQLVQGRPDDVAEVINILLNNAARHAPDSPAAVAVERVGETVRIAISDWGPGVPPHLRSRIFDRDEHGPDSPGEGLGLAVARRLMSDQGGYVQLLDARDTGATFVVGLPAWEGAGAHDDSVTQ